MDYIQTQQSILCLDIDYTKKKLYNSATKTVRSLRENAQPDRQIYRETVLASDFAAQKHLKQMRLGQTNPLLLLLP
jgi:hypothetical protein